MLGYCSELVTIRVGHSGIAYNEMEMPTHVRDYFGYTPREWE